MKTPVRHCNELSGAFRPGEAEEPGEFAFLHEGFGGFLDKRSRSSAT
jgi:hypothetical protein